MKPLGYCPLDDEQFCLLGGPLSGGASGSAAVLALLLATVSAWVNTPGGSCVFMPAAEFECSAILAEHQSTQTAGRPMEIKLTEPAETFHSTKKHVGMIGGGQSDDLW